MADITSEDFETGGIGSWDWDIVRDRVTADESFAKLYGVEAAEARAGVPIAEFFSAIEPADLIYVQPAVEAALRTGGEFRSEYRLNQRDGSVRWVLARGSCVFDSDRKPIRFPGVGFDITDRKLEELRQAALLQLSDGIRDLTDPDAIAFVASEILGRTLNVSRVGYGIINKIDETISIERDWNAAGISSLAGELQFRNYGSYIEDLKAGVTVAIADVRLDPATRETSAALEGISARAFVNMPLIEQGGFVALLYVNHAKARAWSSADLTLMREVAERVRAATERARAEAQLRDSEEQFRVFAQAIPNQVWASQPDGYLYWFNQQALSYAGVKTEELAGKDGWGNVVHPDDLPSAGAAWAHSLATGTPYEVEFRIRNAVGHYRWFLVRAQAVHGDDGQIVRWVGTNTDIEEQRRQAQELAALNETLEVQVDERTRELMVVEEALRQSQKMEAVGQLTGGLAHDFNNLLTGIGGSLEVMQTRMAQGRLDALDRYMTAAQGAVKRAAALTHRLLAFSRRQTLDPKPTDVNRLINGMEELVRRTVGPAVHVEVVGAGGLWSTLVDPHQLENALLNLCINARDAMPDGGRLTVETANKWLDDRTAAARDLLPGQYVSLCVTDTGTGMTDDVISKAFDPFFTTKPLGEGTGLGLSMIYGFVRQSGGQVRIYSELGKGTRMCLYLPRHDEDAADETEDELTSTAHLAGNGASVLIIDDEPTIRMLICELLEEAGYQALEAHDGPTGLKLLQSNVRIDLLITDVGLPGGLNGRQVADAARLARPDLKVLFITGYAENAVVGNGHLDRGMSVVTKPFAMDALTRKIEELLIA